MAVYIFLTKNWAVTIITQFLPDDEVAFVVEGSLLATAAELILLAEELVGTKDGKDAEYKDDEKEDAHQAGNRGKK